MVIGGDGLTRNTVTYPAITQVIPGKPNTASLGSSVNTWTAVYATNGTIQTSDGRVKGNKQAIPNALATLMRLQPKTYFKYKNHFVNGSVVLEQEGAEEAGFVAQDVIDIIPTAVHRPEDDSKALWGMRYEQILPYAVKGIQELKAENDQLRSELATLKVQMAAILARLPQ